MSKGRVDDNPAHPSAKARFFGVELVYFFKNQHKTILQDVLRFRCRARIAPGHGQQSGCIAPHQLLLGVGAAAYAALEEGGYVCCV